MALWTVLSHSPGVPRPRNEANADEGSVPEQVPDGLAFDGEGNLYISMYTPDRVYRLSPDGTIEVLVEDVRSTVVSSPTNIAFGGRRRRTLFLASLSRWHIAAVDLEVSGAPLCYPRIPA